MERQGKKADIDWEKQKIVVQGDGETGKLKSQLGQAHHMAVNKPEKNYSHFVSLPLAFHPELANRLINFRKRILGSEAFASDSKLKGIEESIFCNPKTFHLTIVMLRLPNDEQVEIAAKVLKRVSSKVLDALENRPVSIRLKGLECMRGSWDEAWVLYAPVEEVGGQRRLLLACQVIIDAFVEAGFADKEERNLKLHATIMHAGYRKREKNSKAKPFDARDIYRQYGSTEWGSYTIHEAHISQRGKFDIWNGYYHCCASIPFPTAPQPAAGLRQGRGRAPAQPPFQARARGRGHASTSETPVHSIPFPTAHQTGLGLGQGRGRAPAQPPFRGWGRSQAPAQPPASGWPELTANSIPFLTAPGQGQGRGRALAQPPFQGRGQRRA